MPISETVIKHLRRKGIPYDVVSHPRTATSLETADAANVPAPLLAKAVLMTRGDERWVAVLPADRMLDLHLLHHRFGKKLAVANDEQVREAFPDCAPGAVPALGSAFGFPALVDERLQGQKEIYFEAGDHEELIHVREPDYERLLGDVLFFDLSRRRTSAEPDAADRAEPGL